MNTNIQFEIKDSMPKDGGLLDKQSTISTETPSRWVALSKEKAQEIAEELRNTAGRRKNSAKDYIYGP